MHDTQPTSRLKARFGLKAKFVTAISLLMGLVISLFSFISIYRETQLIGARMDQSGQLLSTTLALASQDPIARQSFDELIPYLERLLANGEDILEICIFDRDGKIVAHRSRHGASDKLGQMLDAGERRRYLDLADPARIISGTDQVEYAAPIRVQNSLLGSVVLKYSLSSLYQAKEQALRQIYAIGLVSMLAGVALSMILASIITAGLNRLVQAIRVVGQGDLSFRLAVPSRDEIGLLALRFNEMLGALEENQKALDRKVFEVETLFRMSHATDIRNTPEDMIQRVLEIACEAGDAEQGSIHLAPDLDDELATTFIFERQAATLHSTKTRIRIGEGMTGRLFLAGQSEILYDASIQRNKVAVPMRIGNQVTGVIELLDKPGGPGFSRDDLRLLEGIAHEIAMAIEQGRLQQLAIRDGLTRLYIHWYFQTKLDEEIARAKRFDNSVSLILLDIDHFKNVNDTYGHPQGDRVLMEVARILSETLRESVDLPARYGGEEFAIVLPGTQASGALFLAERIRASIESFDFPGQDTFLKVTVSLGVASFPEHADTKSLLIKRADLALYSCKKHGRNRSAIYDAGMVEEG